MHIHDGQAQNGLNNLIISLKSVLFSP